MSSALSGQVALVTGAGRGIGRACVEALVEDGARVIAVARSQSELEALADAHPGRVEPWAADVTDAAFYPRIEAIQGLSVLVNNAGGNQPEPIVEVDPEDLDFILNLNVRAAFLVAQAAVRAMNRQSIAGSIINMSSQMGHVGAPNRTVYCMTKHAIEGLTKAMAVELAPVGIRVNTVAPTFIETPMTARLLSEDPDFRESILERIPLGEMGHVDDVAAAVRYLASPGARLVTGSSLKVDGGWTAQ